MLSKAERISSISDIRSILRDGRAGLRIRICSGAFENDAAGHPGSKKTWPRYEPYIEFLFESGWRPNEVNGLKWDKVNMVTNIISVREGRVLGKNKDPKTKQAIRDVHMTPGMKRALKKQMAISYLKYAHVFVGDRGQPIDVSNFRARLWEPVLKKAKVKYRYPYQCRHTFATSHIDEGYSPLWIAKQLGTSVEMVFHHYAVYIEKAQLRDQSLTKYRPKPTASD
ncbi:MAG: site-specific integrase [Deltaproteobacteria bacterium]|nr:site-specific integrase [Deltaproteobacteria bacterium]